VHVRVVLILKPGINGRWILWERCYYFGILEATCTSSRLNGCGVTLATPEYGLSSDHTRNRLKVSTPVSAAVMAACAQALSCPAEKTVGS